MPIIFFSFCWYNGNSEAECKITQYTSYNSISALTDNEQALIVLKLPADRKAEYEEFSEQQQKHFNVFLYCTDDGTTIHLGLNPDLVLTEVDGKKYTFLCATCKKAVDTKVVPKYCIASGYDFG